MDQDEWQVIAPNPQENDVEIQQVPWIENILVLGEFDLYQEQEFVILGLMNENEWETSL